MSIYKLSYLFSFIIKFIFANPSNNFLMGKVSLFPGVKIQTKNFNLLFHSNGKEATGLLAMVSK